MKIVFDRLFKRVKILKKIRRKEAGPVNGPKLRGRSQGQGEGGRAPAQPTTLTDGRARGKKED